MGGGDKLTQTKITTLREKILQNIDWQCDVFTLFSETNLGCKMGPYRAISWFFANESQGIILEDDCLPSLSFFHFCDIMLQKYQNHENIGIISGIQFCTHYTKNFSQDYFFTKSVHTNGWATWRRIWENVAMDFKDFQGNFEEIIPLFISKKEKAQCKKIFDIWQKKGFEDAWDYQFGFHLLYKKTLNISPKNNLVINIGLTHQNATHKIFDDFFHRLTLQEMHFPLTDPKEITRDINLEIEYFKNFKKKNLFFRIINKISRTFFKKHIFK